MDHGKRIEYPFRFLYARNLEHVFSVFFRENVMHGDLFQIVQLILLLKPTWHDFICKYLESAVVIFSLRHTIFQREMKPYIKNPIQL